MLYNQRYIPKINKSIPIPDITPSRFGMITSINIPNMGLCIIKWNKYPEHKNDMIHEIKMQNIAYTIGLAPKIISFYQDQNHMYIIMTNLNNHGYETLYSLYRKKRQDPNKKDPDQYKKIPKKITNKLIDVVNKLHSIGISHRDLHAGNIFYNKKLNDIKIIDFGLSIMYPSKLEAHLNENYKSISKWSGIDIDDLTRS